MFCNGNSNNSGSQVRVVDGQDLELILNMPMVDGSQFVLTSAEWEIVLWTRPDNRVVIARKGNAIESVGEISANTEVDATTGKLKLYIKGSKTPFGRGQIQSRMTIYAPQNKFEDSIQVIKTLDSMSNIYIV